MVENKSISTMFLANSKTLTKFKILSKLKSLKVIKKPNFLIFNTKKTFNFLR